jgi:hypothetical protein
MTPARAPTAVAAKERSRAGGARCARPKEAPAGVPALVAGRTERRASPPAATERTAAALPPGAVVRRQPKRWLRSRPGRSGAAVRAQPGSVGRAAQPASRPGSGSGDLSPEHRREPRARPRRRLRNGAARAAPSEASAADGLAWPASVSLRAPRQRRRVGNVRHRKLQKINPGEMWRILRAHKVTSGRHWDARME